MSEGSKSSFWDYVVKNSGLFILGTVVFALGGGISFASLHTKTNSNLNHTNSTSSASKISTMSQQGSPNGANSHGVGAPTSIMQLNIPILIPGELSDTPSTATGYIYSNPESAKGEEMRLAALFNIITPAVDQGDGTWSIPQEVSSISPAKPNKPSLSVSPTGEWYYYNGPLNTPCAVAGSAEVVNGMDSVTPVPPTTSSRSSGGSTGVSPGNPGNPGTPVNPCNIKATYPLTDAITKANALVSSIGVMDKITWDKQYYSNSLTLSGKPDDNTGRSILLGFDDKGTIISASGYLSIKTELSNLPILGVKSAVIRSGEREYSAFGPIPVSSGKSNPTTSTIPSNKIVLVANTEKVISGDKVLIPYYNPDGTLLMLPGYLLTTENGATYNVISVDASAISLVADYSNQGIVPEMATK
jgi:hypothetical protein